MRRTHSLDADYFEALYRADPDPWGFADSEYEAAKYADTIAALGDERGRRGLEVGCSIGILTRALAAHCDRLVATELSATALKAARRRCADLMNVEFRLTNTAAEGFDGRFDLIVLSEVVYYWDSSDLESVAAALRGALAPGGRLLLVHWLGETDYPQSADDAVGALRGLVADFTRVEASHRRAKYRLDVWRAGATSIDSR